MNTILRISYLLSVFLAAGSVVAQTPKLVIAHYMTDMVPRTEYPLNRWINPELADPHGSTAAIGGISQTIPMATVHLKAANLTKAVDFEIRAARQSGVDGFQFYYPLGDNTAALSSFYNEIIGEFIRLSETRYSGFKISLCLSHPGSQQATTEAEKISLWSQPIRSLVSQTKDSPAWLRSEAGSILFYLWVGDALADGVDHLAHTPTQIRSVGKAYQRLSAAVGEPIDYVYQVRRPIIDRPYIDGIVETFSAVWGWTASEEHVEFWDLLSSRCQQKGCMYTQTVYPDYYTSKVYRKGSNDHAILSTLDALKAGVDGIERHYRVTDLAQTQIRLLEYAIEREAQIINYATWNDFPEGHHLAPEMSHNFGPATLLRHYKSRWQTGDANVHRDQAAVFFKKYRHDARPEHAVSLMIKSENKDLESEDQIELVTLLREPAECYLNDTSLGTVDKGLQRNRIKSRPGPVRVRIVRNGKQVFAFTTPEAITESPQRTDRLTYSYTSDHQQELEKLFGVEQ
jgi:hypothetical protein